MAILKKYKRLRDGCFWIEYLNSIEVSRYYVMRNDGNCLMIRNSKPQEGPGNIRVWDAGYHPNTKGVTYDHWSVFGMEIVTSFFHCAYAHTVKNSDDQIEQAIETIVLSHDSAVMYNCLTWKWFCIGNLCSTKEMIDKAVMANGKSK